MLQGLWESLVFDTGIKEELVQFVETVLYLSHKGVDQNIMAVNKVILLHGPPGTEANISKCAVCLTLYGKPDAPVEVISIKMLFICRNG
jgi:hypothetical protein